MAKKDRKLKSKNVIYIGDDLNYWSSVKENIIESYPSYVLTFHTVFDPNPDNYLQMYYDILMLNPIIVYVDFTTNLESQIELSSLLYRENRTKSTIQVGLVENSASVKKVKSIPLHFTHVKCGEEFDVVYDPFKYLINKVPKPKFAIAKFQKESFIHDKLRVGYISPEFLHVETNLNFEVDQVVELELGLPKRIVKSRKFLVRKKSSDNLYYDYKYSYRLDLFFIDKPDLVVIQQNIFDERPEISEAELKEAVVKQYKIDLEEYNAFHRKAKLDFRAWVLDNLSSNTIKTTKILLVDPMMDFLKGIKTPFYKTPYIVRCQTIVSEELKEIDILKPQIIGLQISHDTDGHPKNFWNKNDKNKDVDDEDAKRQQLRDFFRALVTKIKSVKNYSPFLVIFNCDMYNSVEFQKYFGYALAMAYEGPLSFDVIQNMGQIFEKKQKTTRDELVKKKVLMLKKQDPIKYKTLAVNDFDELFFYVKKTSPLAFARYKIPIILTRMSESLVQFLCDQELDYQSFELDEPTSMSVTLNDDDDDNLFTKESKKLKYQALIHSIDENGKKKIRQFVNEIFFSHVNEQRKQEEDAFNQLNQEMKVKLDKEKEEKAKETAEAEAAPKEGEAQGEANSDESPSPSPATKENKEETPAAKAEGDDDSSKKAS
jgi:hypothetical protein